MIRYEDILFFDTESTGVIGQGRNWETDFDDFPRIVQIGWIFKGRKHLHTIFPDGWEIPEAAQAVHGISTWVAIMDGEAFEDVAVHFIEDCAEAKLIAGHNIYFDTSLVKAQILYSLGREWYERHKVGDALYKGKRIDTMRPAMKWVDARTPDGRLKFPKLEELYRRCFPGESYKAHDALEDSLAVRRCLPRLVDEGLIKLEERSYDSKETQETAILSP